MVKADAYGLGLPRVAPVLAEAGARTFFVARLAEGVALRQLLPGAEIAVLSDTVEGYEASYRDHDLLPVLNSVHDVDVWIRVGGGPCVLQIDTGMSRLGLAASEWSDVATRLGMLGDVRVLMSHLACADDPGDPLNERQRATFVEALDVLRPSGRRSLANSSGIFLGTPYHFDLARPGMALYGLNPTPGKPNPMQPAVSLRARILQVRRVDTKVAVGYGSTAFAGPSAKLITVAIGYADGFHRSLSESGHVVVDGTHLPIVGRVSMDTIVIDASKTRETLRSGEWVEVLGPGQDADDLAREAGTIGYEILTSLGRRLRREYRGDRACIA